METNFSNLQIRVTDLPVIRDVQFSGLHKDYLKAELIGLTFFWIFVLIIGGSAYFFQDLVFPVWLNIVLLGTIGLLVIFTIGLKIAGFKRKQYAVRERDIIYKMGLIWRSTTIIPFNRVQHVEVYQGPLDRLFGLSKLRIYTAGGSSSDLSIAGLVPEDAHRIKHFILNKTSLDEEE